MINEKIGFLVDSGLGYDPEDFHCCDVDVEIEYPCPPCVARDCESKDRTDKSRRSHTQTKKYYFSDFFLAFTFSLHCISVFASFIGLYFRIDFPENCVSGKKVCIETIGILLVVSFGVKKKKRKCLVISFYHRYISQVGETRGAEF